jgi:hypothetical protein
LIRCENGIFSGSVELDLPGSAGTRVEVEVCDEGVQIYLPSALPGETVGLGFDAESLTKPDHAWWGASFDSSGGIVAFGGVASPEAALVRVLDGDEVVSSVTPARSISVDGAGGQERVPLSVWVMPGIPNAPRTLIAQQLAEDGTILHTQTQVVRL